MKRAIDVALAALALTLFGAPLLLVALAVRITSPGPAIHWSRRIGRFNVQFWMPKFRTMRAETPQVATHLLPHADAYVTPLGKWLRRLSIDELPQLWSILNGDLSFVGPRPALFNQGDLISARTQRGVHLLKPGLTGWAQINGRDDVPVSRKVELDYYYLSHHSLAFDLKILCLTLLKVVRREGVSH